jgi:hypothetical protein
MLIGFGSTGHHYYRRQHLPYYESSPGKMIMWIPSSIGFVICKILSTFRFALRSLSKSLQRARKSENIRLRQLRAIDREESGKVRSLVAALIKKPGALHGSPCLPHDELGLIASHLHYVDLINLSRASKSLRAVFLGAAGTGTCAEKLRQYVCEGSGKFQCSVCTMPICNVSVFQCATD